MKFIQYKPAKEIENIVKCFLSFEVDASHDSFEEGHRLWPDTCFKIAFTNKTQYQLLEDGKLYDLPDDFFIGQLTKEALLIPKEQDKVALIGVELYPWAYYSLTQKNADSLNDKIGAIDLVFSKDEIEELRFLDFDDVEGSIQLIENLLINKFQQQPLSPYQKMAYSLSHSDEPDMLEVPNKELAYSERTLQRNFKLQNGLSIRKFTKILKFNYAVDLLRQTPDISLTELAYLSGYTDQSHFIHSFKSLFGLTPLKYKKQVQSLNHMVENSDAVVVNLQF